MKSDGFEISGHDWMEQSPPADDPAFLSSSLRQPHDVEPPAALIVEALRLILESSAFLTSKRGSQFLRFVVQYRLQNHTEPLKERTIGAALFNRPVDYSTGDDSVVRAQAREVRRRLERYYAENPDENPVHIDLPLGSYTPRFRWSVPQRPEDVFPGAISLPSVPVHLEPPVSLPVLTEARPKHGRLWIASAVIAACVLSLLTMWKIFRTTTPDSITTQFWAPAFASSKPLLICLPKPILYRPSPDLYKRHATHPGEFDREIDRMTHHPHLNPDDTIRWGDMNEFYDYGVSKGDVEAAISLSNFLGHQGKDSEVRIGNGYSSQDLRNSPAVIVGAFSNPVTIEMISTLHFAFVDDEKGLRIQEQGGRSWYPTHGAIGEDYGLVTRLVDSTTGQFVVLVAGVEASGSDAAADLIVRADNLEKALRGLPPDWSKKNVQILVSTTVRDSVAGPPRIVAVYSW